MQNNFTYLWLTWINWKKLIHNRCARDTYMFWFGISSERAALNANLVFNNLQSSVLVKGTYFIEFLVEKNCLDAIWWCDWNIVNKFQLLDFTEDTFMSQKAWRFKATKSRSPHRFKWSSMLCWTTIFRWHVFCINNLVAGADQLQQHELIILEECLAMQKDNHISILNLGSKSWDQKKVVLPLQCQPIVNRCRRDKLESRNYSPDAFPDFHSGYNCLLYQCWLQ